MTAIFIISLDAMKAPERFDPSKPDAQDDGPPPNIEHHDNPSKLTTPPSSLAPTKDTPTIKQTQKRDTSIDKKPFQWAFLLPKYWGIWLIMAVVLPLIYLPLRWQFWLGRKLGITLYKMANSRRRDTLINLRLAFPEKSEAEREAMAKQVFVNQSIGAFETLCAWFRPNIFTRTVTISGLQHVVNAQNEGRAVILLGAHYTMLDLGGLLCSQFFTLDCMYRPQNNAFLDWFIYNARSSMCSKLISSRNMNSLVDSVREGRIVWYSPDQDYGLKYGVMAPFFGVPAATITATRRLATVGSKEHMPAVMGLHTYRQSPDSLSRGKRPHYHITITPALDNYPSDNEVVDATRVNEMLEDLIRIDPTQWMWFHRRFKNGPVGRTDIYK